MDARLQVLAAALLFSTGGAAIKGTDLDAWQVAGFRSGIAALVFLVALRQAWARWHPKTLVVAAAYATTLMTFVLANKLTTAANSIFLQSTAPFYIVLLAPWLLGERVRPRDLVFMTAIGVGLALFFLGSPRTFATAPDPALGNLVGAGSGVCWALTLLGLRWLANDPRGGASATRQATIAGNVIAFGVCLPFALPVEASLEPGDWAVVVYLGVFQLALAYIFLLRGIRAVSALEASLLLLVEPALNPVWAWMVHGEAPGARSAAGGAIVVAATGLKAWTDARHRHIEPVPSSR